MSPQGIATGMRGLSPDDPGFQSEDDGGNALVKQDMAFCALLEGERKRVAPPAVLTDASAAARAHLLQLLAERERK